MQSISDKVRLSGEKMLPLQVAKHPWLGAALQRPAAQKATVCLSSEEEGEVARLKREKARFQDMLKCAMEKRRQAEEEAARLKGRQAEEEAARLKDFREKLKSAAEKRRQAEEDAAQHKGKLERALAALQEVQEVRVAEANVAEEKVRAAESEAARLQGELVKVGAEAARVEAAQLDEARQAEERLRKAASDAEAACRGAEALATRLEEKHRAKQDRLKRRLATEAGGRSGDIAEALGAAIATLANTKDRLEEERGASLLVSLVTY